MLVYSYRTQIKQLQTKKKMLEIDLMSNPSNERAKEKLNETIQEIKWFKSRPDPGMRVE